MTTLVAPPTRGSRLSPPPRRRRRTRLLPLLLVVAVVGATVAWILATIPGRPAPSAYNRGTNAVWLAHTWVEDPHTDVAIAGLAQQLRAGEITDVFVHVGPLDADGSIPPERYPRAAEFTRRLKAEHGGFIRLFAWIGQIEDRGGGILDIGDADVRRRIAASATIFPDTQGFDGIHYDIEPLFDRDERFLALLDETRVAIGHRPLSVATGKWLPDGPLGALGQAMAPDSALMSSGYYREIARRVEQVVPMLYDTGARPGDWYEKVIAVQLLGILRATEGTGAAITAGVPTYDRPTAGHDPASENLQFALPGVSTALYVLRDPTHFAGVALYAHWETSDNEWQTYEDLWIGSATGSRVTAR